MLDHLVPRADPYIRYTCGYADAACRSFADRNVPKCTLRNLRPTASSNLIIILREHLTANKRNRERRNTHGISTNGEKWSPSDMIGLHGAAELWYGIATAPSRPFEQSRLRELCTANYTREAVQKSRKFR